VAQRRPLIAFDARDAFVAMPHGSGVYVRHLLEALSSHVPELWAIRHGGPGPEVVWEQVRFPWLLRARGAALVHGPDSFLPLRRPCPGVLTVHDLAFEAIPGDMPRATELKYRALVPRCARSAQAVICPSSFTADDLERRYRLPRERLHVIPEAAALPVGSLDPPAGRYVLAAGDLRPKKNLRVLVRACRRLWEAGMEFRLVLAGADCGDGAALRRLAGAWPVELTGFVDDARLDALLRGAAVVVVPSLYEGFGLVALDAMVRGRAVVLARAGALPETGGEAAAYFDAADPGELAGVLEALLSDDEARAALGAAGRARAASFTWEAAAVATAAVYAEVLGG
jgi:glycosyltransferase involved in cell wall biosynthesis